jgi:hypothetical protein
MEEVTGRRKRVAPQRYDDFMRSDDNEVAKNSKVRGDPKPGQKRRRCGDCAGCNAENCGECLYCKDMPQYGGKGNMRQTCKWRVCEVLAKEIAEAKAKEQAERAVIREAEREVREAEREARLEARRTELDARRADRLTQKDVQKLEGAQRAAQMAVQLSGRDRTAGVRMPSVALEPEMNGGWGMHFPMRSGTEVEVHLMEEGLEGQLTSAHAIPPT